jgi:NADPH:quinone reductase-like Zn-dependent oxidoreductase
MKTTLQKEKYMKAIVYKKYGSPEVFEAVETEKPAPQPGEVLIKVFATTVTAADCMMRRGDTFLSRILLGLFKPAKKYQILGTEFSGTVEATGNEVTRFKPGDEVYAFRGFGTGCYAQYKCMNEKGSLALKPSGMGFPEAASVVDGATTALFFLKEKAKIQKGQKVLINGASGSVGSFAVQLAKYFGAEVTGVCSTGNIELVKSLGADKVVDYTKEDFTATGDTYDIIFDTIGKSSFTHCRKALNARGKYVATVINFKIIFQSLMTKIGNKKKVIFAMSLNKTEALNFIRTLIEEGKLKSIIDRQYLLEEMSAAHSYVEKGHKTGNVVITVKH